MLASPFRFSRHLQVRPPFRYGAAILVGLLTMLVLGLPVSAQERMVRVGLAEGLPDLSLETSAEARLTLPGQDIVLVPASASLSVRRGDGAVAIRLPDRELSTPGPIRVETAGLTHFNTRRYRGVIEVLLRPEGLTVVNELGMEPYLYGVVPCEVIPSWPTESLKAQAIAARTYAMANLGQFKAKGYDLSCTVLSQVYRGASAETPTTNRAVDETRGQILQHNGKPIQAYFHDSAGGYTEDPSEVWGGSLPYLQPVPDFDQGSPRYEWRVTIDTAKVQAALEKLGFRIGRPNAIEVLAHSASGRVKRLRIDGQLGSTEIEGPRFRMALGLRSTRFAIVPSQSDSWEVAGRGWGHGVGLSQWGAKTLAEWGFSAAEILAHYYPGAQLSTPSPSPLPL